MSEQNQKINSRLNKNNRKKKTNTILNVLIGVVLLLIIIVVVNLVTGDKEEKDIAQEPKETESVSESSEVEEEESEDVELTTEEIAEEDEQNETANEENDSTTETGSSSDGSNEIIEESDDPNVEAVVVDPSWEPIGTAQVGEHVSSYTKETVDWEEKVDALAYAANLDPSNMIVQFLGNGGSPQKSIGTVTSKDGKEIYRISLEWVDGQGWKPTKKEKLLSAK